MRAGFVDRASNGDDSPFRAVFQALSRAPPRGRNEAYLRAKAARTVTVASFSRVDVLKIP